MKSMAKVKATTKPKKLTENVSKTMEKIVSMDFKETKLAKELKKKTSLPKITTPELKTGKLEGNFWVWPNGVKTNLTFIQSAIHKMKPLPLGFYAAAEKSGRRNLKYLVDQAKKLGLEDTQIG